MSCHLKCATAVLAVAVLFCVSQRSMAHFTWIATDDAGHALLFFSEGPHERDYHVPDAVAAAEVKAVDAEGKSQVVSLADVDEEEYVGRRSEAADFAQSTLSTNFKYGIYGDTLLSYYAKSIPAGKGTKLAKERPRLDVDVQPSHGALILTVYWEGKPLPDARVSVATGEEDAPNAKTNKEGKARFGSLGKGLIGFLVGHVDKDASGELDGKPYQSESHYCTVTYHYESGDSHHHYHGKKSKEPAVEVKSALPELPEGVASFGAAVCDSWLYIYSGHTGTAHDHSRENLSQKFIRIPLDGAGKWEDLPMQTPLQGFPLVAHKGMVYRVGGLSARNAPGEDEDLHSVDEFCRFDTVSKEWKTLSPLPEPRSSHDAVVIGDKLYVVGGWTLSGSSPGDWLETAWVCDLSADEPMWEHLPKPPFQRRALAVAAWGNKLVVMGGMDADNITSNQVDCFDPKTGEWTQLAEYPGGDMSGFGMSAWGLEGTVYASGWGGVLYRLTDDGKKWEQVEKFQLARFFHRLMPSGNGTIYVVAGATAEGHVTSIEEIDVN